MKAWRHYVKRLWEASTLGSGIGEGLLSSRPEACELPRSGSSQPEIHFTPPLKIPAMMLVALELIMARRIIG